MDVRELVFRYFPLLKKHWLPLSLGILGMIFFAYGLIGIFSGNKSADDIVFEANSESDKPVEARIILVDVEGAVENPGVYKLPQESRIQDALVASGGLSGKADREYVAKNFNLAIKLVDGSKVYIPEKGETESITRSASSGQASSGQAGSGSEESGQVLSAPLININTASESQLDSLPGVGPATVQKIISGRPYGSIDELLSKKIVGAKVFGQIKDKISVY